MEIPLENLKKNNVQHSRKRVKQDKDEADFFHSQSQKRRRKNPEQNAVAGKESKLKLMHNLSHNSMSSRHVKSFSTIQIDLL